ncbi:MAG: hypothetical protein AAB624_04115 [Patescibacteria group bacterium]
MVDIEPVYYKNQGLTFSELGRVEAHIRMGMLSQAHLDAINGASAELVRLEVDLNDSPESKEYLRGFRSALDEASIERIML